MNEKKKLPLRPDFFLSSCLIRKKFEHNDSVFQKKSISITQIPKPSSPLLKNPTSLRSKAKIRSRNPSNLTDYSHSRFINESILPSITDNTKFSPSPSPLTAWNSTYNKLAQICSTNHDPTDCSKKLFNECMNYDEYELKPLKKCIKDAEFESFNKDQDNLLVKRDKSLDFCRYLQILKEKGSDKLLCEKFRTSSPRKKTTVFSNVVKNLKIMRILRGNSKGKSYIDTLNKVKKYTPLQKNIVIKSPEEIIEDLIHLLELLEEIYGSSHVTLSILKNLAGFMNLEDIFMEPRGREFNLNYTVKKMKEDKGDNEKNFALFRNELKDFLKKKQMELAEKKAEHLEDNLKELKLKTFEYLLKVKIKNQKKYTKEKKFLLDSIDFIQDNQIQNKFKLHSLKELEASEKIVGKFEKINDIPRFIAKSMDLICRKTGF